MLVFKDTENLISDSLFTVAASEETDSTAGEKNVASKSQTSF